MTLPGQAPWPTDKRTSHDKGWREDNPLLGKAHAYDDKLLGNAAAYDDLLDYERRRGRNWRWASFLLLLGYAPIAAALAWTAGQSHVEPVIVMLDEDARERPVVRTMDQLDGRDVPEEVVGSYVADWIKHVRARPSDLVMAMDNLRAAYAYVAGDAANKLDSWMKDNDPRQMAKGEVVQVEILAATQETQATWQIRWKETDFKNGYRRESNDYTGLVTIERGRPRLIAGERLANPLGLDIVNFGWSAEATPVALRDEEIQE